MAEPKRFKVTKEEYAMIQRAKLKENEQIKEQIAFERDYNKKKFEFNIKAREREIAWKEDQLKKGHIIEFDENTTDKKKPAFALQNEIDHLALEVDREKKLLAKLEEEMRKDAD